MDRSQRTFVKRQTPWNAPPECAGDRTVVSREHKTKKTQQTFGGQSQHIEMSGKPMLINKSSGAVTIQIIHEKVRKFHPKSATN